MNIAMVAAEVHKHGGVPYVVAHLIEDLRPRHSLTVFSSQLQDIDTAGIKYYHVPMPSQPRFLRPLVFIAWFNALFTWHRLFRGVHYDIVHTQGEEGAFAANVVTSHFCQAKELEALHQGLVPLPMGTWEQKLRALDYYLNRRVAQFLEWWVFGRDNPRLRTVVSDRMKQDFVHYYGAPAEAIVPIPNGVDIQQFNPRLRAEYRPKIRREHGLSEEDFLLFFIGGDWERKGVPQAIETLAYLPDPRIKLLVVGMGDADHYRRLAERYGVAARVTFVTRFVRQAQYYAASDVFLFPTQYEPFGLVVLEAMATGIPVVTSAIAGVSDYLQDGVDAFLVDDARDAHLLASKVEMLYRDRALYEKMSVQGRAKAESMSWEAITQQYEQAYRELLGRQALAATGGQPTQSASS